MAKKGMTELPLRPEGIRGADWSKLETFGIRTSDPDRWKLNRGAPEQATGKKAGQSREATAKNRRGRTLKFPKVDPAYNVDHKVQDPRKVDKARIAAEKKSLAKQVLRLAKQENITPREAAERLKGKILARTKPANISERTHYLENR